MEVIIYLAFSGLILMVAGRISILNNLKSQEILATSEVYMEGENALAYIEDEIRQSHEIAKDNWNKDRGLGFILKKVDQTGKNFTYIRYKYDPANKSITRLAYKSSLEAYNPDISSKDLGSNLIIDKVTSIDASEYDVEKQLVKLSLEFEVAGEILSCQRLISLKKRMNTNEKF